MSDIIRDAGGQFTGRQHDHPDEVPKDLLIITTTRQPFDHLNSWWWWTHGSRKDKRDRDFIDFLQNHSARHFFPPLNIYHEIVDRVLIFEDGLEAQSHLLGIDPRVIYWRGAQSPDRLWSKQEIDFVLGHYAQDVAFYEHHAQRSVKIPSVTYA